MERIALLLTWCILLITATYAHAQNEIVLTPVRDNTLYESGAGNISNGAGEHLFAGTTNIGAIRRALIAFDLSEIPSDARVDSITLTLNMSRSVLAGQGTYTIHRVLSDWGEGPSQATGEEGGGAPAQTDDATWIHTFFDTATWDAPGGDFAESPSSTMQIGAAGPYAWPGSDDLVADVQSWIQDPAINFGWIILGDESADRTAKRFDSREHPTAANRPTLRVYYGTSTAAEDEGPQPSLVLGENFPDPARTSTTIPLQLDAPRGVVLEVFDLLGRSRMVVLHETLAAGEHRIEVATAGLPNGAYFYCLSDESGRTCRTLVVAR